MVTVDLKTSTDVVNNIVTSSAVVIGGIWAYLKFIRGRTFAYRAELGISSSLQQSTDCLYLSVAITFRNTGLSKIPLNKDMKVVRLFSIVDAVDRNLSVSRWKRIFTLPILDEHDWVEAQESVTDSVIYSLQGSGGKDSAHVAYQVEALIGARRRRITRKGERWQARAVVFIPATNLAKRRFVDYNSLAGLTRKQLLLKMITLGKARLS
jgi:hypothetical protein